MFNPLPLVKAELKRTYIGAIAVVLLIAVSVALGIAISSQERAIRKGTTIAAHDFDILIGAPGSPTQLVLSTIYLQSPLLHLISGSILKDLQNEKGVSFAAPIALGDHYGQYPIIGTTSDLVTLKGKRQLKEGHPFSKQYETVIGSDVGLSVGANFTPVHGHHAIEDEHNKHEGIEYTVVGRMPRLGTPWDRAIIVPIESMWGIHGLSTGHSEKDHIGPPWSGQIPDVSAIVVKPISVSNAYKLKNRYNKGNTIAIFPAEILLKLYDVLGNIRNVMAGVSLITQIMVLTAIMLTIFVTLDNRRRQIAVLRAIGATPAYVFSSVWLYMTFLILVGTGLGVLLGWLSAHLLSAAFHARTGLHLPVIISGQELILATSLILAGMLLAIIPAWMSYRLPVAESLKMQG